MSFKKKFFEEKKKIYICRVSGCALKSQDIDVICLQLIIYNHHHNWLKTITFIPNFPCNNLMQLLWKNFPPHCFPWLIHSHIRLPTHTIICAKFPVTLGICSLPDCLLVIKNDFLQGCHLMTILFCIFWI